MKLTVNDTTTSETTTDVDQHQSINDLPNPIPKPPRGNFVPDNDDSMGTPPITINNETPDKTSEAALETSNKSISIDRSSLDLKLDAAPRRDADDDDRINKNNTPPPTLVIPPPPLCTPPVEQATPVANHGKIIVDLDAPVVVDTVSFILEGLFLANYIKISKNCVTGRERLVS